MGEKQIVTKKLEVGTFKVQYVLCSENISLFHSVNLGVLFVCSIQKILVLVREKVEKNCIFFLHVDQRAKGENSLPISGVMVTNCKGMANTGEHC